MPTSDPADATSDDGATAPSRSWDISTLAVTAGRPTGPGEPLNVPPTFASTYRDGGEIGYGRWGNPTWTAFETAIGVLEGGRALGFASGIAATAAVLETLPAGACVLLPADSYTGTRGLLADLTARGRLTTILVDMTNSEAVLERLSDAALLWIESPSNPLLGVVDLRTVLTAAAAAGVPAIVDNTLATPVLQRPLELGATAVVTVRPSSSAGTPTCCSGAWSAGRTTC